MKRWIGLLLLGASGLAAGADVRDIELRRLLAPTAAELRAEAVGRIYIYDGLRESDIAQAMDEEFERVENMMFIRTKKTTATGEVVKDQNTGQAIVEDDGC